MLRTTTLGSKQLAHVGSAVEGIEWHPPKVRDRYLHRASQETYSDPSEIQIPFTTSVHHKLSVQLTPD